MGLSFFTSRRGNVAMIFALCIVPLIVLMGGAIDLSRQRGSEANAQNALDAALLAVAQSALGKDDAGLTTDARAWFDGHMGDTNLRIESFTITKVGQTLKADMTGTIDTSFLALMGIGKLTVKRNATVAFGLKKVELALVLDTTGSMLQKPAGSSESKLEILQKSAKTMMNTLEAIPNSSGKIEVSIVPFATYVNVGTGARDKKWIDNDGKSPVNADNLAEGLKRFDLYDHLGYTWKGCVQARPAPYDTDDTRPQLTKPETLFVPVFHPDEIDPAKSWYSNSYPNNYVRDVASTGNSFLDIGNPMKYGVPESILSLIPDSPYGRDDCIGDVDANNGWGNNNCDYSILGLDPLNPLIWVKVALNSNYNYYSDVFSSIGPSFNCDMRPVTQLTSNFTSLRSEIDALTASGSTNINEGVAWGWRTVSPTQPFNKGDAYSNKVEKVIVVLTDGNNMAKVRTDKAGNSDFFAYGYLENERLEGTDENSDQTEVLDAMDNRTLTTCENAKELGIRIITIRLGFADDRSEEILSTCASSPEDYMDVQDPKRLGDTFKEITNKISQIYLSE